VLEDGTYRRVGESTLQQADVRIVSATCRDLKAMVAAGTFRRDLFYRLEGAQVVLPPLRARSDRSALAAHLLVTLARKRGVLPAPRLSPEVLGTFERYTWPGNVRELHTLLDVSLILAAGSPIISLEHLPPEFRRRLDESAHPVPTAADPAAGLVMAGTVELAALEASAVRRVLSDVEGNVSLAARRLGIARSTLYRMIRRYDL
jgi:transcriptional regulator with PAS, ATPase and Fis domain